MRISTTATERGYGLSREQVVGRSVEEVLGVEQAQLPLGLFRACVRTGENQRYTARRTMAGVTRTIDVMFARVPEKHDGDWLDHGDGARHHRTRGDRTAAPAGRRRWRRWAS